MTLFMRELRDLFEDRLRTVDQRHRDSPQRERDRIKGQIRNMLTHIDASEKTPRIMPAQGDLYHGDF